MESSVVLDPQVLEVAALIMFERLTLARGQIETPCRLELLDEQVRAVEAVLSAVHQKPPQAEVDRWRDLIRARVQTARQAGEPQRLVFRYHPSDHALGLTGGIDLGIALEPATDPSSIDTSFTSETADHPTSFRRLSSAWGEILFPCVPTLLPHIIKIMGSSLGALGQQLSEAEIAQYHQVLETKLTEWFTREPETRLVFRYGPLKPDLGLEGGIEVELVFQHYTLEHSYRRWTQHRSGALFGEACDAKVMAVATEIAPGQGPDPVRILDVGAGTGRNTFPLARAGFQVEAVELTQTLSEQMIQTNQTEQLNVRILTGDFLDRTLPLLAEDYDLVFLSEVAATHFHTLAQVRQAVGRMCELTRIGGWILFDLFLCWPDYEPSLVVRQISRVNWTHVLTETDLQQILLDMPVELISNESSHDFERAHTPAEHWPPTPWYEHWATGRNLFPIDARPPIELRWLLFRRLPGDLPAE